MMKNIKLLTLFTATLVGSTVRAEADVSVIPGASYWTIGHTGASLGAYDVNEWGSGVGLDFTDVSNVITEVKFYTYDGNLIHSTPVLLNNTGQEQICNMLDPEASKPQPVRFILAEGTDVKIGKYAYVKLLDKHGNIIDQGTASYCSCGCKHISPNIDGLRKKFDISKIRKQLFQ